VQRGRTTAIRRYSTGLQLDASTVVAYLRRREAMHRRLQLKQMQRLLGRFVVVVVDGVSTRRTRIVVGRVAAGHVMLVVLV